MAVAPDGRFFVTERLAGRVRIFDPAKNTVLPQPVAQLTGTAATGERGLLGIALDPGFPKIPYVYVYQTYSAGTVIYGRILRLTLSGDRAIATKTIVDRIPTALNHNGGVLAFGPDGKLYLPLGDVLVPANAQNRSASVAAGKIHRFNPDGTIPRNNPFGAANSQFSLGHRNSFGLAFHPLDGRLYESENGPNTGDEIQIIRPGGNYGWPYELGNQGKPGFDKPIHVWTFPIAPCGLAFSRGTAYPISFLHSLWVADYAGGRVRILRLGGQMHDKVLSETLVPVARQVTDVKQGLDGRMYACSLATGLIYRIDWSGTPPRLPEFAVTGPVALGTRNWQHLRGKPGAIFLVLTGTRLGTPLPTPFGTLLVNPLLVYGAGVLDAAGVASFLMPIPANPVLKGIRFSLQGAELRLGLGIRLAGAQDLTIR